MCWYFGFLQMNFGPLLFEFAGYIYRAGSWVRFCSGMQRLVLGLRIGAKFVP